MREYIVSPIHDAKVYQQMSKSAKPKTPTPATIGAAIYNGRKKLKLSQVALSRHLNISNSHLCLIEQGKRGLTPALIAAVSKLLKLKPSALITPAQREAARAWKAMG